MSPRTAPSRSRDSVARLFSDALAGRVTVAAFSLINIAVVTRAVGPSTYGVYAGATGFSTILYFFTDLGSSSVVVREAAGRDERERAVATFLHARALLTVLTCLGGAALVPLIFDAEARSAAYLALAIVVFSGPAIASPLGQVYGSMRLYRNSAVLQGAAQLLLTVVLVLLIEHPEAVELVGALCVAAGISTAWVVLQLRYHLRDLPSRIEGRAVRTMLRSVGLLGLSGVLVTIYYRIDGLLLLRMRGPQEAGLYAAAYRLLDQAKVLPAVVLVPVAPLLARELAGAGRLRAAIDGPLMRLALLSGIGLASLAAGAAPWAIDLLMGDAFAESKTLFAILVISLAWSPIAFVLGSKAINGRLEPQYLLVAVAGVVINVASNLVLIPAFGAQGAAAATAGTELATVAALVWITKRLSAAPQARLLLLAALAGSTTSAALLLGGALPSGGQVAISAALVSLGTVALLRAFHVMRLGGLDADG